MRELWQYYVAAEKTTRRLHYGTLEALRIHGSSMAGPIIAINNDAPFQLEHLKTCRHGRMRLSDIFKRAAYLVRS